MADFLNDLKSILFLDIETASISESLEDLDPRLREEWAKKAKLISREQEKPDELLFWEKAGIYAEFGKVICIGVGFFNYDGKASKLQYRTKAFASELEHDTLWEFRELLEKKNWTLCAHNGKEFDFPFICRRMLANRIPLPEVLQLAGKKPWEVQHLDTLELWKFGDYKHYTRLELLAALFDIPSSKDGIDGSQVNGVYYQQNDLATIAAYCIKDVEVTARLYLAFQGLPSDMEIEVINLNNLDKEGNN